MVSSGTYRIKNVKGHIYLDESKKNPGKVHGWSSRPENDNQKWEVQQSGGGYTIRNVATGKYLSANGTRDGTDVKASSNPTTWDIREEGNSYAIIAEGSDAAVDLDLGKNEDGTEVNLWNSSGKSQQKWTFEEIGSGGYSRDDSQSGVRPGGQYQAEQPRSEQPRSEQPPPPPQTSGASGGYSGPLSPGGYYIQNVHSGTALDLSGASSQDGANVIGYQVTRGPNQIWILEPGSRGYRFKNHASGTYAGYQSHENPTDGVLLTGNRNQVEWTVQQVDQGYQIHLAQNPNLVLDLASGDKSDGAKICLWSNKGENNQKWNFSQ